MGNDPYVVEWRCVTCKTGRPIHPVQPSIDPRWGLSECDNPTCGSKKSTGIKGQRMRHQAPFRRIDATS